MRTWRSLSCLAFAAALGLAPGARAGTLAWWNFETTAAGEHAMADVDDLSGNKLTLRSVSAQPPPTASAAVPASPPGPSGNQKSAEFSPAARTGLSTGAPEKLNFGAGSAFTLECWICPRAYAPPAEKVQRVIFQKRGGDRGAKTFPGYNLTLNGEGKVAFRAEGVEGGGKTLISERPVPLNEWTHVAVTRDAGGRFRLYVNGKPDGAPAGPPFAGSLENDGDFVVGYNRMAHGSGFFFDGFLDDLRVTNTDLKPDELLCK
jgi:hypothetical protein